MASVYEIVTERICTLLEKGVIPWERPWVGGDPMNLITKKPYSGVNRLLLGFEEFSSPYWATYKQVEDRDGHVKKGEKSRLVVFYRISSGRTPGADEEAVDEAKEKRRFLLRYYHVFNMDQTEGITIKDKDAPVRPAKPDKIAGRIVFGMPKKPAIRHAGTRAYYAPSDDRVTMPPLSTFRSTDGYYGVLFHELVHSTGHESRLARKSQKGWSPFGSSDYSQEELVAEIGSAFLLHDCGMDSEGRVKNSAAYVQNWLKALSNDKRMIVQAANAAQKAHDYICGKE